MNNLADIASENQRQWKSINALAAEVKSLSGTNDQPFSLPLCASATLR